MKKHWIWPPETGIQDLPADWERLAHPSMREVERDWKIQKSLVSNKQSLQSFLDELGREWAIETGQIENLYQIERGVTQSLIEHGFKAALIPHGSTNRDRDYVVRLLKDQEAALEGLFAFVKKDQDLTISYIKQLHAAMTRSQEFIEATDNLGNLVKVPMERGVWKTRANFPSRGDDIYLYCPPEQTANEMEKLVELHKRHREMAVPPEVEAAWLHHRFTQIHPFADGNGRVARALATLVLVRANVFPLVIPAADKDNYFDNLAIADSGHLDSLINLVVLYQQRSHDKARRALFATLPKPNTVEEAMDQYVGKSTEINSFEEQDLTSVAMRLIYAELENTKADSKGRLVFENLSMKSAELHEMPIEVQEYCSQVFTNFPNERIRIAEAIFAHNTRASLIVVATKADKFGDAAICCLAYTPIKTKSHLKLHGQPLIINLTHSDASAELTRWTKNAIVEAICYICEEKL